MVKEIFKTFCLCAFAIVFSACSWVSAPDLPGISHPGVNTSSNIIEVVWNCNNNDSVTIEYDYGEWHDDILMIPADSNFYLRSYVEGYSINCIMFDYDTRYNFRVLKKEENYIKFFALDTVYLKEFVVLLKSDDNEGINLQHI